MGFRTVSVKTGSKIETRLGYLLIRNEEEKWILIDEISTLIVESTACAITTQALLELSKENVNIIFCNEKHLPYSQLNIFNGNYETSKNIKDQSLWEEDRKFLAWQMIVIQKISHQKQLLIKRHYLDAANLLDHYQSEVLLNDTSNREGHAAKVYFGALFGVGFSRRTDGQINAILNYAYSILLSEVARQVVVCGYINNIGIWHCNQFNQYNLACDLMEIFRPIIDEYVIDKCLGIDYKNHVTQLLLIKIKIKEKLVYLEQAIEIFCRSVFGYLKYEQDSIVDIDGYEF
jgi:CRISPR-associated endonuclease Cas1 subtype II